MVLVVEGSFLVVIIQGRLKPLSSKINDCTHARKRHSTLRADSMHLNPKSVQNNGLFFEVFGRCFAYLWGPGKDQQRDTAQQATDSVSTAWQSPE